MATLLTRKPTLLTERQNPYQRIIENRPVILMRRRRMPDTLNEDELIRKFSAPTPPVDMEVIILNVINGVDNVVNGVDNVVYSGSV